MADPSSGAGITVKKQWIMIAAFSAAVVASQLASILLAPEDFRRERHNAYSVIAGLIWWLGHGVWLSMDRRRRGLEPGAWRYLVIFLGPVAIWLYLVVEYRARALYLIPLSLAVYLVIGVVLMGLLAILGGV